MATAVSEIRKNITAKMCDKDTEDGEMLQDYLDIIITNFLSEIRKILQTRSVDKDT